MLSYNHRFHGHNSLRYVYKNGRTQRTTEASLRYIENPKRKHTRIAVVVSKKVSKSAVTRNRIRRRVYELFRRELVSLQNRHDIVVTVVAPTFATMPPDELEAVMTNMLRSAKLYKT